MASRLSLAAAPVILVIGVVGACADEAGQSETNPGTPNESSADSGGVESDASEDVVVSTPDAAAIDAGNDAGRRGSVGCGTGKGIPTVEQTLTLDGNARRYFVYLPTGYTNTRPWPVVFALHPNGSNAGYWNATTGERNIRGLAEKDAVLVVAEAIGGNWRDYAQPEASWPARVELELKYFDTIHQRLTTDLCIDEKEIFSMGFSGGASFSGVLGCRRSYIRAIAAGGAVNYFDATQCVNAPAAWVTMGALELPTRGTAFRDHFRGTGKCATTSKPTAPNPPCIAYDGCDPKTPVTYCQHAGDHVWPAFGTAAAWAFFEKLIE